MSFLADASLILLVVLGLFLILIVLLQRGRGGGLAGALGGAGGTSAFGTKTGDVFTWITIYVAAAWFILAGVSGLLLRKSSDQLAAGVDRNIEETVDTEDDIDIADPQPSAPPMPDFGDLEDSGLSPDEMFEDFEPEADEPEATPPSLPLDAMTDDDPITVTPEPVSDSAEMPDGSTPDSAEESATVEETDESN